MIDVIIIGAGPAGTAAGYRLACSGFSVLMLDRRAFPRKKACAGGITPKAMALFDYDISGLVQRTCRSIRIKGPGGKSFTIQSDSPLCHMVDRPELDLFSLNRVTAAGGRFRKVDQLLSLEETGNRVMIRVVEGGENRTFEAAFAIGADGANSRVRQLLDGQGTKRPGKSGSVIKFPALEADVPVQEAGRIPMTFDFSRDIPGYYWIFPKKHHVNIGIYATKAGTPMTRAHLESYARDCLGTDRLEKVKGYPIGVLGPVRKIFTGQGRILLAGDAAGLAEPLLGEGIYPALKSGRLAARAICRAGREDPAGLQRSYQKSLLGLYTDSRICDLAAKLLYRFPAPCLGLAAHPFIHTHFARGYAAGKPVSRIFLP